MIHASFEHDLRSLKKRYALVMAGRWLELFLILAGLFFVAGVAADQVFPAGAGPARMWLFLPAAAGISLVVTLFRKEPFLSALVAADRRLGSKDLLSSACEVCINHTRTRFSHALTRNAAAFIRETGPKKIFPLQPSSWLILVPIFAGVGLLFILKISSTLPDIRKNVDPQAELHEHINVFEQGLTALDDEANQQERFRQIERTASRMIKSGENARQSALKSFSGLLKTIESQVERDLQDLKEQLNLENSAQKDHLTGGMNIPSPVKALDRNRKQKTVSVELEGLEEKITEAFDEDVPEHLSRQLGNIRANQEFAKYLENLLKKYMFSPENVQEDKDIESPEKSGTNSTKDPADQEHAPSRKGKGSPGSSQESFRAGSLIPESRKKVFQELEPATGPMEMEPAGDFKTGSFGYAVKALTTVESAMKPEQEIKKIYIKQNEAVIQKENIPPEYRESIRDYFLSIGLEGEDQDD